jgi:hemerythrin-like domain-containing protein
MSSATFDQITREHAVIAAMMDLLDREVGDLASLGHFDIDLVRLILRYMNEYPDRFHHRREELLFDVATGKDASFATCAEGIRAEHSNLPDTTAQLADLVERIELGEAMPRDVVLGKLRGYIVRQREHIRNENEEVFPAMLSILNADDWSQADSQNARIDDPLAGGRDPGPFRRLQELILSAS